MANTVEFLHVQQLISETAVEALGVAILPRTPRCDVKRLDLQRRQPLLDCFRDELRSIVATDASGNAVHRKQLGQPIDHVLTGHAPRNIQIDAAARVLVNDRQPFQRVAAGGPIEDEVPTPNVIGTLRTKLRTGIARLSLGSLFMRFSSHF